MIVDPYVAMRAVHVACVAESGSLFAVRGVLMFAGGAHAHPRGVRWLAIGVDTVLLAAAVLLMRIIRQYPLHDAWLTAKAGLLIVCIGLGHLAFRSAAPGPARRAAFIAATLVFGFIVGVAVAHDPAGWFALLRKPS